MLNYKKLFVGLMVVAMVFGVSALSASALTPADIAALTAALSLTPTQQATLMSLLGGTGSPTAGTTFSADLTVGSRSADVTALQQVLIDGGYLTIAAPTGYFGSATKAALTAWQTANGVSPASGYFGPLSRAKLNSMGPVTPPVTGGTYPVGCTSATGYSSTTGLSCTTVMTYPAGCTSASGFSSTTGLPCTTATTLPAGCTSTTGFSVTTGQSCSGGVTPPGQGTEGSITTKLGATPADNSNVRTLNDVSVYGVEVEAVNSDMIVDRADLEFTVSTWGSTTAAGTLSAINPGSFINTIKAWDGSTLVGSWPISTSSFSKDSSDKYHIILSGLGANVAKGAKKNITFSVSVNAIGSTDVPRRVAIQGYSGNTQNIRSTDTKGLQSYANMSGTANTRTHDFKAAGASTLAATINSADTPLTGNTRLSTTNGILKMKMLAFDAKSESGDSKITKVYVQTNATATAGLPSTLYLCDASDTACSVPLGSVTDASRANTTNGLQSAFTGLSINVPQDTTKKFFIAADFPTSAGGQAASSSLPANSIKWEKPDGGTASTTPSSALVSKDQYIYTAVPKWSLNGTPTAFATQSTGSGGNSTTTIDFKIPMKLTSDGGAVLQPTVTSAAVRDFTLLVASSTQTTYTPGNNSEILLPGNATSSLTMDDIQPLSSTSVGDGGSYTFTLHGILYGKTAAGVITQQNGGYFMILTLASSTVGGNAIAQTWGLETFRTPSALINQ